MVQDATPASLRDQDKAKENGGTLEVGFYNIQDGQKGRDGGPYLDHVERQNAELRRAFAEDREPEDLLDALPPAVGTVSVTAGLVPDNPYSNPSMALAPGLAQTVTDDTFGGDPNLADPMQKLSVDFSQEAPEDSGEDVAGNKVPASQSPDLTDSGNVGPTLPADGAGTASVPGQGGKASVGESKK